MNYESDIIVSCASLAGSAIGVIRMSGAGSVDILDAHFTALTNKKLSEYTPGNLRPGYIKDVTGVQVDQCMAV